MDGEGDPDGRAAAGRGRRRGRLYRGDRGALAARAAGAFGGRAGVGGGGGAGGGGAAGGAVSTGAGGAFADTARAQRRVRTGRRRMGDVDVARAFQSPESLKDFLVDIQQEIAGDRKQAAVETKPTSESVKTSSSASAKEPTAATSKSHAVSGKTPPLSAGKTPPFNSPPPLSW